jgi:hypothetical protein
MGELWPSIDQLDEVSRDGSAVTSSCGLTKVERNRHGYLMH